MADVNWREAGFLAQTTGNYPDASDVADKDNIFLTESGWVYRHFRNQAKTKFWDEIIWAGYVDAAVVENDPVDEIDEATANVTFLVGDGYQYVEGPYPLTPPTPPAADTTITGVSVSGPDTPTVGDTSSYTVAVTGDATPYTYTWGVPVGESVASGQGTASITVTWGNAGNGGVTCLVGSTNGDWDNNTVSDTETVTVGAAPSGTTTTYTVTVGTKTAGFPGTGGGSAAAYFLDGSEAPVVNMSVGDTAVFNQDDATNFSHPLGIYDAEDKSGGETTDGTITRTGTAGTATATVTYVADTAGTYYYECGSHVYMGWQIVVSA